MKKLLMALVLIILVVIGAIYTIAFTPYGNAKVAPIIKDAVDEALHVDSKVEKFLLTMSDFELILYLTQDNKIEARGSYSMAKKSVNATYGVMFEKLADLKVITKTDLVGALHVEGSAEGDEKEMIIKGKSDLAQSDTRYKIVLNDFEPSLINANITNASLSQLLSLVKQPHYSDGFLSVNANIKNAKIGQLDGEVITTVAKGTLDTKVMDSKFALKNMPSTTYSLKAISTLNGNNVVSTLDFNSNLANLDIKKAVFDVTNSYLKSDYTLSIPSLDKLYFVTNQHLKGKMVISGDVSKDKDLRFNANSNTLGGKIKANLVNDKFNAELNSLNTLAMLDMLMYPQVFDSTLNGTLKYNIASQKGDLDAKLGNGHFVKNQMFDAIKTLASTDMYKYTYESTLKTDINKEMLTSDLKMVSNNVLIDSKQMKLNTKTKQIDASFDINANKNELSVKLSGDVNKPKVEVDATKILKKEGGKLIKKELNKHLDKKTADQVNNLLNKLF